MSPRAQRQAPGPGYRRPGARRGRGRARGPGTRAHFAETFPGQTSRVPRGRPEGSGVCQRHVQRDCLLSLQSAHALPTSLRSRAAPPVSTPTGSTGKTQSSASLTKQGQQMNKVDELTLQLQMMINERNELRAILTNYTNNAVNNRLNSELEELNMDHQKETSELEIFPKEISEASSKCKELTEKTNSYRPPLRERTQMKERVDMLKEDNRKLQQEQIFLQESCEETKRLLEEAYEKIYDLLTKQQQEHQRLEEHLQSLLKRKKLVTQQRDLAVKLQHHFTESQMRFEHLQHELEQTTAQEESLLQMELLQQEGYVPAPRKRTEKPGGNERHLEGMTFYTPGSRPPLKKPRPFSCEHSIEVNSNRSSEDPATI